MLFDGASPPIAFERRFESSERMRLLVERWCCALALCSLPADRLLGEAYSLLSDDGLPMVDANANCLTTLKRQASNRGSQLIV